MGERRKCQTFAASPAEPGGGGAPGYARSVILAEAFA
jgi:hypothetical protein